MKLSTITKSGVDVKPIIFHIGWMRTGTTFLQGVFQNNPRINLSLKNRFFSYDPYYSQGVEHYKNQIILSTQTRQHFINVDSDENYAMGRFKTQLREKQQGIYNQKSELGFIHHDISEMVLRMKDCAPEAKVFGLIRKQPAWFESVYKHDVYHFGLDRAFPEFYESELGRSYQKAAYYFSVYQEYVKAFGKENVKILLFEDFVNNKSEFVQELSDFLGVDIQVQDEKKLKKNASTSSFFTQAYRYANMFSEKDPAKQENFLYGNVRKLVGKLDYLSNKLNLTISTEIIPKHLIVKIKQHYSANNKQLAAALHLEARMKQYGYF